MHDCAHQCPFNTEFAKDMMEAISDIKTSVATLSTMQTDLRHTLLGNGQPGKCQIHSSDISKLQTSLVRIDTTQRNHSELLEELKATTATNKDAIAKDRGRREAWTAVIAAGVSILVAWVSALFRR